MGNGKIKCLLVELERAGFIERRRELRKNLKAERHIHCLKYAVSSMGRNPTDRLDGSVFDTHENRPVSIPKEKGIRTAKVAESAFDLTLESVSHPYKKERKEKKA